MIKRERIWIGGTMLAIILLNYGIFAMPLMKKTSTIDEKVQASMKHMIESKKSSGSEEQYMLQLLMKERSAIDSKLFIINCAGLSLGLIAVSWTIFGMLQRKK